MRKLLVLFMLLLAAGCRQAATPTPTPEAATQAAQIDLSIDPQPPAVGDATLTVTVTHDQQPIEGAQVDARGDMNMAGMAPVLGSAKTDADGKASVPFKWSMGGDWIVTVTVTLADGSEVSQDFNVSVST